MTDEHANIIEDIRRTCDAQLSQASVTKLFNEVGHTRKLPLRHVLQVRAEFEGVLQDTFTQVSERMKQLPKHTHDVFRMLLARDVAALMSQYLLVFLTHET